MMEKETRIPFKDGKSLGEIVREYFPDIDDDQIEYIVWNRTGYPCFWKGDPEESLRESLAEYKVVVDKGIHPCTFCNNEAFVDDLCKVCYDVFAQMRMKRELDKYTY